MMLDHLNVNSRRVVSLLCNGSSADVGNEQIDSLDEDSTEVLALLAVHMRSLQELPGGELVDKVVDIQSEFDFQEVVDEMADGGEEGDVGRREGLRLGKVRACSFRGLAPARRVWEHDFEGLSHLLHGPNGSGKSSLLGAICWCLTGKIFRDDRCPDEPEKVIGYSVDGGSIRKLERDDALALLDENGNSSLAGEPYWVEVELIQGGSEHIYLRRHSAEGLSWSEDGTQLSAINSVTDAGIDELDCELRILMLANLSHMRFGKKADDLVRLLAEVAGYGELGTLGDIAKRVATNSKSKVTKIEKDELGPEKQRTVEAVRQIREAASSVIKGLDSYDKACDEDRTEEDVKEFGLAVKEQIQNVKGQLAADVGLEVPEKDSEDYGDWEKKSNELPGQISGVLTELEKPLGEICVSSIGFELPSSEELMGIEKKLGEFEEKGRRRIEERLEWARREKDEEKLGLMLKAAAYFPEGSNDCPVCSQSLEEVEEIKTKLDGLRADSRKGHLHQKLGELERALAAELNGVVSHDLRGAAGKSFGGRIVADWEGFKKIHCKGLLLHVAERFDEGVKSIAGEMEGDAIKTRPLTGEDNGDDAQIFSSLGQELHKARQYIALCKCLEANRKNIETKIKALLTHNEDADGETAFKDILEQAKDNVDSLAGLLEVHKQAGALRKSTKQLQDINDRVARFGNLANSVTCIKDFGGTVRKAVRGMVAGDLGQKTQDYYEKLYDNDILEFEQLTMGHAGNPDTIGEVNLYLKAAGHQVPMGPYSNAGRMRALLLSFAFALLDKSCGCLDFVILDDPVLSLDDEHKARFVDGFVEPFVKTGQVILGTHYRDFYKNSEYAFEEGVRLRMIPRRRACDKLRFEAGDLLERVKLALDEDSTYWEEAAGNIRKWIERTLATLSGYCPEPFLAGKLGPSIDNYENISDPKVATRNRDQIIRVLRSPAINRVADESHHDGPIERKNVEDAVREITKCSQAVKAEIRRFKGLYNHALLNRHTEPSNQVALEIVRFTGNSIDKSISVVRKAAAAHNGQGIEWGVTEEYGIEGCPVVQVCADVIAPVALNGQYLLLDWADREAESEDLVVVKGPDGSKLVRRIWLEENGECVLVGTNPTHPCKPVRIVSGKCEIRRIVGVLYGQDSQPSEDGEWGMRGVNSEWFDDIVGIRVKGTSLEPVARNGQIVLVKRLDTKGDIANGTLACVSVRDEGDVIKRWHTNGSQCILSAVNPTEREESMVVDLASIQRAYELKGVLFEVATGIENV